MALSANLAISNTELIKRYNWLILIIAEPTVRLIAHTLDKPGIFTQSNFQGPYNTEAPAAGTDGLTERVDLLNAIR